MRNKLLKFSICMLIINTFFIVTPDIISAEQDGDYIFTVSGGVATITGYTGSGGIITIPSTLAGYPTVHIGNNSFYDNLNLESVTIPRSVITIGNSAFDSCSNLTLVVIPNNVTIIGIYAFISCSSLTSVTIPSSVITIGNGAFASCSSLTSVTIPSSVSTIGNGAFSYCSNLTSINVDEANIHYASGNGILYNKDKTTLIQCPGGKTGSISIPNSVNTIENSAFISCTSLTSVIIPNSVTTIDYNAFASCFALNSVTIGSSVTTIGKAAFFSCSSLTSIIIPNSVISIGDLAFSYCPLTSIVIPNSVTTIGFYAFSYCPLTSVTIGSGMTTIGNYAFISCTSLYSITFLGLVAPIFVGTNWILNTPVELKGHAYMNSDFPAPGNIWNGLTMGTYTSMNNPPMYSIPSPMNGSSGIALNFTWSILINDPEGNSFDWQIECSNGQFANANGASNGTKSLLLSELTYSTSYRVWVNTTDPTGSGLWTRRWYTFTTRESGNNPPVVLSAPSPENGSSGNVLSLTWSIQINDLEGDLFSWTIQCNNGQKNSNTSATNGTKSLPLSGLSYSTSYKVWVNATDPSGSGRYTKKWYTFTTRESDGSQPPVPPAPTNKNPIADASAGAPYQGFVNSTIIFDGLRSYDPDGTITEWFWMFGDNMNGTGKTVQHTYLRPGTYIVTLKVTDNEGATNTDTVRCMISEINNRPPTKPAITGPKNGTKKTLYNYSVISTDADNDTIQYSFNWGDPLSIAQHSGFLPNNTNYITNHSWSAAGRYEVIVTVTDNQTENSSKIMVYIDAVQTGEIGYLLDNNGDGTYDTFYSDVLNDITTVQKKNGNYYLDSDGNGDWDYTYNITTGLSSLYHKEEKTPDFEMVYVICAAALIIIWMRKRTV